METIRAISYIPTISLKIQKNSKFEFFPDEGKTFMNIT